TKPETGQLGFTSRHAFATDPKLVELAFQSAQSVSLDEISGHAPKVYKGRVVSGDQFISSVEKAGQLLTIHNALAVDMEAAAIAHTCEINKVPFLCVRAMSDKADHSANVSFTDFLVAATDNYGKVFDKLIKQL
ncbi:MAG TPA: 5'-methylthioadenosine/S-adenosylhomocysteine nucleosidase, partial [Anaerolineales bacterium]|nr:5'-methylthioadenosine/S-adenosylhomocysteine nucleosidase [Anaerolineales bacterium]